MKYLILFLSIQSALACKINTPIVSLSGPVSYLLKEFKLTTDSNFKAVSSFHHFVQDFNGQRIAGGIYLSLKRMKELEGEPFTLFVDESQELQNRVSFLKSEIKNLKEVHFIKTRNKDPFQVTKELLAVIDPYLSSGCGYKVQNLRKDLARIELESERLVFPAGKSWLFYLGDKSPGNQNQTLLVNDSFNLIFKKKKNFKTYPSNLAYVSPSIKILRKMKKTSLEFGLAEYDKKELKVEELRKDTFNLYQEGVLYPGLSQVYFIQNFARWVSRI